jgi:hypothetical protein
VAQCRGQPRVCESSRRQTATCREGNVAPAVAWGSEVVLRRGKPGLKPTFLDGTIFRWTDVQLPLLKQGAPTAGKTQAAGRSRFLDLFTAQAPLTGDAALNEAGRPGKRDEGRSFLLAAL